MNAFYLYIIYYWNKVLLNNIIAHDFLPAIFTIEFYLFFSACE